MKKNAGNWLGAGRAEHDPDWRTDWRQFMEEWQEIFDPAFDVPDFGPTQDEFKKIVDALALKTELSKFGPPDADEAAKRAADGGVTMPVLRTTPKIGRNAPCTCGSGLKYKKCCGA